MVKKTFNYAFVYKRVLFNHSLPEFMEYSKYTAEDFASDTSFIRWVKDSDSDSKWFWASFVKNHPEKMDQIEEARKIVSLLQLNENELSEQEISTMRNRILMAIQIEKESSADLRKRKKPERFPVLFIMRWAAIIIFLLSFIGIGSHYFSPKSSMQAGITNHNPMDTTTQKVVNPKGRKSVFLLADGTKVWLNADSRFDFKEDFNSGSTREVYLDGEAYFDVARNPAKPFIVHTNGISIKVLGTAFNVKSYTRDKTIETTLVHGKVSINKTGNHKADGTLILKPNQRAVFTRETNMVNVEQVVTDKATAWRFEKLIFDETPLSDVFTQLERWYDVKIHVANRSELKCSLTAEIENEKLDDVLQLLVSSHKISYTISGKEVFIKGVICK